MDDFQYVVTRVTPHPICFGSKVVRDTNLFGKALSPFQKHYVFENYPNITPQSYTYKTGLEQLDQKIRSNRGVGGLAILTPRFPKSPRRKTPSPTRSIATKPRRRKKVKKIKVPFGKKEPRSVTVYSSTPGPGHYDIKHPYCARTKMQSNFGHPEMLPAVEEKCVVAPVDKCDLCGHFCNNDYWHINYTQYICNFCMQQQKVTQEYITLKELKKYQKIRSCSINHNHEGTTAAVWLLPKNQRYTRVRIENYLSQFLSNF